MKEEIYNLLYKKSVVDGVRLIYEDQWPIEELAELFKKARTKYNARQMRYINKKIAQGLCGMCGKPVSKENKRLCQEHRDQYMKRMKKWRLSHKGEMN